MDITQHTASRRALLQSGLALAGVAIAPAVLAQTRETAPAIPQALPHLQPKAPLVPAYPRAVRPELMRAALNALERHQGRIANRDRIAIADFAAPSASKRLHIVDLQSGATNSFLVAHGSGSDPSHSGWLQRFSNDEGSNASCEGAFATADYYVGKHGRSQRLLGLDPTNSNALARAIVIHSAWYSNENMIPTHGMLGRSQGCLAVGEAHLDEVFERLGPGRMVFSAKISA